MADRRLRRRTPRPFAGRRRHSPERGLSLIEMIVAIFVISVGVLGIASAFTGVVKTAGITQDQAQLESASRQLADYLQSRDVRYKLCATSGDYALPVAKPAGLKSWSIRVYHSTDRDATGDQSAKKPLMACPRGGYDWGVQEIAVTVSSASRSLTRIVWKGDV